MNPVWLLCLSNIRKNKIQNGIITLIIFLSTLLLSTAFIVMSNSGKVFNDMHDKVKGSHNILNFESNLQNPNEVYNWWKKQDGVTTTNLLHYKRLANFTHANHKISNINLYMMSTQATSEVDKLIFTDGSTKDLPVKGTVWIPSSLAISKGIKVGDELAFGASDSQITLKVSAIVIDVPYCQPFTITARIWMNPMDYREKISVTDKAEYSMLGLRFDNIAEEEKYWNNFKDYFGKPFLETFTDFNGISSFYLIINQIISFVMIFLAVVMILIAVITIGFTISDAVLSKYRTIGILKSCGLSSKKVVQIYVTQYIFLAILAILPALSLSYFFSRIVLNLSVSYLRTEKDLVDVNFINIAFLVGLLVIIMIGLTAMIFSLKTRLIKPAQAIRYGMSEKSMTASKINILQNKLFNFEKYPISLIISLRGIFKDGKGSALIVFITLLTTSVLTFGFIFIYSILSMNQTTSEWGYDNADVSLEILNQDSQLVNYINKEIMEDSRVKDFVVMGGTYALVSSDSSPLTQGIQMTTASGDYDEVGYKNLKGKNPKSPNEISIGVSIAKNFNKNIGDNLDLYLQGKKATFKIVGIYQSLANMSNSGRITLSGLESIGLKEKHIQTLYIINLNNGVSAADFVKELDEEYKDNISISTQETLLKETYSQALPIIVIPLLTIGIFFIIVAFVVTYSISGIKIYKEGKVYALYKSLGMSTKEVRLSIALSAFYLSSIGSIIGIFIGIKVLPNILNLILSNFGIVNFPIVINWLIIPIIVLVTIISVTFGSWYASKVLKKSSIRTLLS